MKTAVQHAGGWPAILYSIRMGRRVGYRNLWRTLSSRNVCKTCALGMGGQQGGMRNEQGHWPEVCKKSIQAAAADMQGAIQPNFYQQYSINQLKNFHQKSWSKRDASQLLFY